jgi:hypothetical protein
MLSWLKRHFIPSAANGHRPHFLHSRNTRQLLGIVLLFELVLFILPAINFTGIVHTFNLGSVLPGVLATLTNEEREGSNLPDLIESPLLDQVAQMKAEDMAVKGYFAHTSPEGLTPWYWFDKAGYKYSYAGENLAVNFTDSQDVTRAWMNSPTHRANIVGAGYTEVGTGVATGIYNGQETIFVAQVYGRPAIVSAPTKSEIFALNPPQNASAAGSDASKISNSVSAQEIVLGESEPPIPQTQPTLVEPTFVQEVFSSPRHSVNAVLYVVLAIILVAIFLEVAIKFEYQHPDLVTNGLLVAVAVAGIYLGNIFVADKNMQTSFVAFEEQSTNTLSQ